MDPSRFFVLQWTSNSNSLSSRNDMVCYWYLSIYFKANIGYLFPSFSSTLDRHYTFFVSTVIYYIQYVHKYISNAISQTGEVQKNCKKQRSFRTLIKKDFFLSKNFLNVLMMSRDVQLCLGLGTQEHHSLLRNKSMVEMSIAKECIETDEDEEVYLNASFFQTSL